MSKIEVTAYVFKCDRCGNNYDDGDGGVLIEDGYEEIIEEEMLEYGWKKDGDKHYCPKCVAKMKKQVK